MEKHIRLRSGAQVARTVADYDAGRPDLRRRGFHAFCYAPFLSMDFDATGAVRLCNHSHTAIAQVSDDISVLDVWRGAVYQRYRAEMASYIVDGDNCKHCVRQCAAGSGTHVFAIEQFDRWMHDDAFPKYPKRLIFRLNSTCNLACVMCDGLTSSRIRAERDHLPIVASQYGERFFRDMEEILPHVDHLEFYGGEPFLVKEHVRIFEILARKNVACSIYVNTNAVSFHPRARQFLETLNFKTIAVSMDAVDPELHGEVRRGLRSDVFFENFEYLMSLRAKRGIDVMLNVTEHRKNWFELPQVFRFAEEKKVYLHINTCIHPHNVTLYTLPSDELAYVLDYLKTQKAVLSATYRRWSNASSYDFLLSLVESELASRGPGWKPSLTNLNLASDGHLAAPRPGVAPFETPDAVTAEVARIERMVNVRTAARLLAEMRARLGPLAAGGAQWRTVLARVEQQLADVSHRLVPA